MVNGDLHTNWLTRRLASDPGDGSGGSRSDTGHDGGQPQDDSGDTTASTDISIKRRSWLTAISALAVAPSVATGVARADNHGYGAGEYGNSAFGDPTTEDPDGGDERVAVETRAATDVTSDSASLSGELAELDGVDTASVYFEWGPRGALSNTTDEQELGSPATFDDEVTGLESKTDYEFRVVAESESDSDTGDTLSFTTTSDTTEPEAAPEIERLSAEDTSNPRNPHADIHIEWEASIEEGDLAVAELTVSDSSGAIHSRYFELSGQSAARSEEERLYHCGNETYTVELTVRSDHDTTDSEHTIFDPR